jgi:hypothetical protein
MLKVYIRNLENRLINMTKKNIVVRRVKKDRSGLNFICAIRLAEFSYVEVATFSIRSHKVIAARFENNCTNVEHMLSFISVMTTLAMDYYYVEVSMCQICNFAFYSTTASLCCNFDKNTKKVIREPLAKDLYNLIIDYCGLL